MTDALHSLRPLESVSMKTRDGVRLDADVYRPDGAGPFPVLLMRQPYGRAIASTVTFAHPTWYARRGFLVVVQDVRGRGTSEGDFDLFASEREDGFDTVQWAANLPGSAGVVGMYGFSYQGATQLLAAADRPPALRAICPAMSPWDVRADMAYDNGAFRLQSAMGWAVQLAAETARRRGDASAFQALHAASYGLPLHDQMLARPAVLDRFAPDSHYHAWLAHPTEDEYWSPRSPHAALGAAAVPALWIGGWYDAFLDGTLSGYRATAAHGRAQQRLIIGPWAHIPWSRRVGAIDFGADADSPIDELQVRWFDHWLKGRDTGMLAERAVRLFEMDGAGWCDFDAWPDGASRALYLTSGGCGGVGEVNGMLAPGPDRTLTSDVIVHDPWRPVPVVGGHLGVPPGPYDRAAVDARADVLTYTTPSLDDDVHLAGDVVLELWCGADVPSFDVSAVLSVVRTDGRVPPLVQGHARVDAPRASPLRLPMRATCARVARGNALRLSVAGACAPAYALNLGTGTPAAEARQIDARVIAVTVSSGAAMPSRVLIPARKV